MTIWTEIADKTGTYRKYGGGFHLLSQDGNVVVTEDSFALVKEGNEVSYDKEADNFVRYIPYGGDLKLGSEAFSWLATEGTENLIVLGKDVYTEIADKVTAYAEIADSVGTVVWTEIGDNATTYTKVTDVSTSYTEESDKTTRYIPYGGDLRLGTEAFVWLATEGTENQIVLGKDVYTEIADKSTAYTKINDI